MKEGKSLWSKTEKRLNFSITMPAVKKMDCGIKVFNS